VTTGYVLLSMLALAPPGLQAQTQLHLSEVLQSVAHSYPPLLAALLAKDAAAAEYLSAQGRFDTRLRTSISSDRLGFYANEQAFTFLDQPLGDLGGAITSGWRVGNGDFAPYDGRLATRQSGEWRSGINLPLVRNRQIDERRAQLRKTSIDRGIASLSVDQQRLAIIRMATVRYWDWVASGRRVAVVQAALEIAETRDAQLREGVRLGQLAAIEVAENARAILQRRSQLVEAERALQQSGFELSMFYRNAQGNTIVPAPERVPPVFPLTETVNPVRLEEDIRAAIRLRPDPGILRAEQEQAQVDAALARNQRLPAIDFGLGFTAEAGQHPLVRRGPREIKATLSFDLPFQRREATGKLRAAEAKLAQLRQRERFALDAVTTEARDAASAVDAAHRRFQVIREEVEVTRQLEDAERFRFQAGDGTLFMVNLREQATVEAATREIAAQADYFRALAAYDMAVAAALR